VKIVILQHPKESKEALSTTPFSQEIWKDDLTISVGLSWPSLKKVLGPDLKPKEWAVVYLGTGAKGEKQLLDQAKTRGFSLVSSQGHITPEPIHSHLQNLIKGLVFLDGSWPQVKSMWWKNPWLTKHQRIVLFPQKPSHYASLRREPKKECLSTAESIMFALEKMEGLKMDSVEKKFQDFISTLKK
jgi:hypothetical protein